MHGILCLHSEIFGRFDQTDTEQLLPETVDRYPGRQWMFVGKQPTGQVQAIPVFAARSHGGKTAGCQRRDLTLRDVVVQTSVEYIRRPPLVLVRHDHNFGCGFPDGGSLRHQRFFALAEFCIFPIVL